MGLIFQVNGVGFILTMWYVNPIYVEKTVVEIDSFILTMWYVNSKMA